MADYLRTIDTIEKAYILGLVHKYNIALTIHNKKIIKLLKSHSIISSQYNNNCIITLGDNINNEKEIINNAILDFPNFSEECKLLFVRGVYESNFNSSFLLVTDNLKPIFNIIIENYIIDCDTNNIYNTNNKNDVVFIKDNISFINRIYNKYNELTIHFNNYNPTLKVYKTDENAVIPAKAFEDDAGYDLTIIKKIKDFNSKTSLYDTGIKIEIEEGYYTEIVPRSSISKSGYMLANSIGIIDNNYRGNLMIALTKICDYTPEIELPFKCCQLIIRKQISANLFEVKSDDFTETERNEGGFGSTSK
jgi:deoxyuridine 5'-triphosphate nucleotidohydrolase